MGQGVLFREGDGLTLMESFQEKSFKLIYLDPPYSSGDSGNAIYFEGEKSIRHYLAKIKNCKIGDITIDEVKDEKQRRENHTQKSYREYITKLLENAQRLLTDDGVLCLLAPSKRYTDINFQFMLDQMFEKNMNVTIEGSKRPHFGQEIMQNNDTLYFYSKSKDFEFTNLKELADIKNFPYKDDFDNYRLVPCDRATNIRVDKLSFEWKGIMPKGAWTYSKEKMQDLERENRLDIRNNHVYLKLYRTEHPVTVSSVWKHDGMPCYVISEENMKRMFSLFVNEGDKVLAPFERDGVFPYIADQLGLNWSVLHQSNLDERRDKLNEISPSHYIEKIIEVNNKIEYKTKVITSASEAKDIQEHLEQLSQAIVGLQKSLDIDASEDVVEAVIDKMHRKIVEAVSYYSLDSCYPEAEEWLLPYWENLEEESKLFIPTGIFLYKQLQGNKKADVAAILLEYCKSLEKEMFQKMFKGYISGLISEGVNIETTFANAFEKESTCTFAEFLLKCTTDYRDDDSEWKFEMGKMRFVLQMTLSKKKNKEPLIQHFRDYLEKVFDSNFFRNNFNDELSVITNLRNDCAHGEMITINVDEGREMIRKKLLLILKYSH